MFKAKYFTRGLSIVGIAALVLFAAQSLAWGPSLGTVFPHSLETLDKNNTTRNFESLSGEKGIALVFIRSLDWCPFCKRQIIEINKQREAFDKLGITLIGVSYDSPETLMDFSQQFDIEIELLSDAESEIINALGIRNEEHKEGTPGYGIPHPGIIIVDTQKKIRAKFNEDGYRNRPKVEDVLTSIKALNL